MIDPASQAQLKEAIADCIGTDQGVLDALREEIRPLKSATLRKAIQALTSSRSTVMAGKPDGSK
ncbi:hypothetical protein [Pandoraea sp. CB10b_02]|jgi:hypothetical protein|uniref:hypothetical protein n=1 Tax=Pandoraea sp. CB10b_02 TaxID=2014535 RepID=UPI00257B09D5|nr:hypothetical protein [Pandoraea sp. CB10b_02]